MVNLSKRSVICHLLKTFPLLSIVQGKVDGALIGGLISHQLSIGKNSLFLFILQMGLSILKACFSSWFVTISHLHDCN